MDHISVDVEAWFDYTEFSVDVEHPGSGPEYHINIRVSTDGGGYWPLVVQLSETTAKRLHSQLSAAIDNCRALHDGSSQ